MSLDYVRRREPFDEAFQAELEEALEGALGAALKTLLDEADGMDSLSTVELTSETEVRSAIQRREHVRAWKQLIERLVEMARGDE